MAAPSSLHKSTPQFYQGACKHGAMSDAYMVIIPGNTLAERKWKLCGPLPVGLQARLVLSLTPNEPAQDKHTWACGLAFCISGASSSPHVGCSKHSKGVRVLTREVSGASPTQSLRSPQGCQLFAASARCVTKGYLIIHQAQRSSEGEPAS